MAPVFAGKSGQAQSIIISPHLTEQTNSMIGLGKYTFKVSRSSNKVNVKEAIERLYKVRVRGVNMTHIPSKKRRRGKTIGQRPGYKKAIVTLHPSDTIEII